MRKKIAIGISLLLILGVLKHNTIAIIILAIWMIYLLNGTGSDKRLGLTDAGLQAEENMTKWKKTYDKIDKAAKHANITTQDAMKFLDSLFK